MARKKFKLLNFIMWLTGVLVALAVGFGMINKVLSVPYIPTIVIVIAGWVVVAMTIIGAVIALVQNLS